MPLDITEPFLIPPFGKPLGTDGAERGGKGLQQTTLRTTVTEKTTSILQRTNALK